jgi:hypothetical protein
MQPPAAASSALQGVRSADGGQARHLPPHRRVPKRGRVSHQGVHKAPALRWVRGADAVALQVAVLYAQPAMPVAARCGDPPRGWRTDSGAHTAVTGEARPGIPRTRSGPPPAPRDSPSQSSWAEQSGVGWRSDRVLFRLWTLRRLAKPKPDQAPEKVLMQGART